jgi:DNA-binding SARP family transcriptional activator
MSHAPAVTDAARRSERAGQEVQLSLLGAFELRAGDEAVPLPMSAQRLLVFLAVHDRALLRPHIAGNLWLESSEEHAHASLRSALWRLNKPGLDLVESTSSSLRLAGHVRVDFREADGFAHALMAGSSDSHDLDRDWRALAEELLPDWYDDWVLIERERYRQLALHALEILSERLAGARRFGAALETALAAVKGEPLRESAHRVLIKTHIAEGNASEAIRQYQLYRRLLHDALGAEPSPAMESLVEGLTIR